MRTAIVVYRSHSGVTRRYGEEIAEWLRGQGIETKVVSVGEANPSAALSVDYFFIGCWTSGLFVAHQHPDEPWLAFVREMPSGATDPTRPKVAIFTTYKLVTGSQFLKMRAALVGKAPDPQLELKSRKGRLSAADRAALAAFIAPSEAS